MENTTTDYRPAPGLVIVVPDDVDEYTPGGIALPESAKTRNDLQVVSGTVLAVGAGRLTRVTDDGHPLYAPLVVAPGNRVVYKGYSSEELPDGNCIIACDEIIAVEDCGVCEGEY